ncbi:MAG: Ig-like domain-containing protein, partial [candidate division Zixibacteria bacterium]|nr:Ig-like domain-containing protein [candidate division Zixibacteria bacterium]
FVINPDSSGTFDFNPDYTQSGEYIVTFIASDGALADSADVVITVSEEGNMAPVFDSLGNFAVNEGDSLAIDVSATDPDGGPPSLAVNTAMGHYTFVDNGDGTGRLVYRPDFFSAGLDTVRFIATDDGTPQRSTTAISIITTNEVNLAPAIDSIGPFSVRTDRQLVFTVAATDSTDADPTHRILLTAINPPVNSFFVDNLNNTGTFTFSPVAGQEGVNTVTFLATDQGTPQLSASRAVQITVVGVNQPPILAEVGAQTVLEGETLEVVITATDPDGGIPALLAANMPINSNFVDSGNGVGVFTFTPSFVQSGLHDVTFKAYDGLDIDKEVVLIQVYEAGNQVPQFTMIPSPQVTEGETLEGILTAADPDSTPVFISLDTSGLVMENFALVDSGNGVASFTISPNFVQAGFWDVSIAVSDGELADTSIMTVEVIEAGNQPPVLKAIEDQSIKEGLDLTFTVIASDPDEVTPKLSASPLPPGATFTDYLIGRGDFKWSPGPTDSGTYPVKIYAEDGAFAGVFDSLEVIITVIDSNFAPSIFPNPFLQATNVFEGETLTYRVQGSDPDGDFPVLGARLSASPIGGPLAANMVFEDSANGFGGLRFAPDHTQGASNPTKYYVMFIAFDALDSAVYEEYGPVTFNVYPKNILPTMTFELGTGPFSLLEGQSLAFSVKASDVDGAVPPVITVQNVPPNASLSPPSDSIRFAFFPDYTQSGQYTVRFVATDNESATTIQDVIIDVGEVGNQSPRFITVLPAARDVSIGILTEIAIEAFDPERETLTLTASPAITNASFLDFGDGTGIFFMTPDLSQLGSVYTLTFIAEDPQLAADTISTVLTVVTLMRGDADSNRRYTMNDIVYLCSYLFRGGPAPTSTECGDVDNSGETNVADIAYLVNYLYKSGPRPPQ